MNRFDVTRKATLSQQTNQTNRANAANLRGSIQHDVESFLCNCALLTLPKARLFPIIYMLCMLHVALKRCCSIFLARLIMSASTR